MSTIITQTETHDIGSIGMGLETTIESDNDEDEDVRDTDWRSAHEFFNSTVSSTSASSSSDTAKDLDAISANRKGSKREKLKSLKEKTINALRHSDKGTKISDRAGESRPDSTSPHSSRSSSLITRTSALLAHPRTALKATLTHIVAGQLSTLNAPYIPQAAEVEFVEAHNERDEARRNECQGDVEDAERKIKELLRKRRNMQVNWTINRHVTSVVVTPTNRKRWPMKKVFFVKDEVGRIVREANGEERIEYVKWLGQLLLYQLQDLTTHYIDDRTLPPPITIDRVRSAIERLFVSTAPWQEWLLHVRRVYRWEDPYETFRWLTLYVVLWHYSYIMTFLWLCVIFFTLRRHFDPERKVGDLRDSIERTRATGKQAYRFGEVIEKNGPEEWLLPLTESLGPWALLQLSDLANFLEILENFYEWRSPRLTFASLSFFLSCFLIGLITDTDFCMKLFFFILGLSFFFWFPISSRYPKYRYLVSPLRWIFWNIPTHAEWAFQELQNEAQKERENIIEEAVEEMFWTEEGRGNSMPEYSGIAVSPDEEEYGDEDEEMEGREEEWYNAVETLEPAIGGEREFASFKCRCGHHIGRLVIYPSGIRFKSLRKHRELWNRTWWELVEMKKTKSTEPVGRMLSLEALEISFTDGGAVRLVDMVDRNEAFKWIMGYSRLRWRSND